MASNTVEYIFTARNEVKSTAKNVQNDIKQTGNVAQQTGKQVDQLSGAFNKLFAVVAGAVSIQKVIEFSKQSIELFKIQEKAVRLSEVAFGDAAMAAQEYASAMQKISISQGLKVILRYLNQPV